jgi:hypothetical protein
VDAAPGFIFDLARSWVESGAIDIAYAQGRRATYLVPRRPLFVASRVATYIHATLIGLVPSSLRAHVERVAVAKRCDLVEILPPCRWLPTVLRLKCDDTDQLQDISQILDIAPPQWLQWPLDGALDLRPDDQGLREGAPHEFFYRKKAWDWSEGKFVRIQSSLPLPTQGADVSVEIRAHQEHCPIYPVILGEAVWGWTHIRNWALLFAYVLKDGYAPLKREPRGRIRRKGPAGVYLPLPIGRLCAVLGDGLSGPILGQGASVAEYVYPLAPDYLEALSHLLPVNRNSKPKAYA